MTVMTTTSPYRLRHSTLRTARLLYMLLLLLCLSMFAISLYGKVVWGATGSCAERYAEPGWEDACADWRAAFDEVGLRPTAFEGYFLVLRSASALPFLGLSLLLMRRRGDELRVLLLSSLLLLLGISGPIYNPFWQWAQGWYSTENQVPILRLLILSLDYLLSVGAVWFAFLFPDGRFAPRWSRWIAALWALLRVGVVFFPDSPASVYTWPLSLGIILTTTIQLVAIGAFGWRYRIQATAVQRQQIKWITAGGLLLALNYLVDYGVWEIYPALTNNYLIETEQQGIWWELGQDTLWYLSQIVFAICVGLAVFRYRLWDIDPILSRTLVYGCLTVLIVSLYILIVGGLGAVFHAQTTALNGLLATGIIAVLFHPLRDRLQRVVNRVLYGERDDPASVLTRLAHQLETADTPTAILPHLVQTIAHALKIPHVAISLPDGAHQTDPVVAWGDRTDRAQVIPLVYQNEAIGNLTVAPRGPQEQFNRHEQRLLATIAALTATTVRAVQLSDELHHSRQRIITAREEERRRLRRDLHDGLGPALASLPLKIDAAIDLIEHDQPASVDLLGGIKRQAQHLVADIRRVVHDLRPPALDELGLAEALRGALAQIRDHPNGFQIHLNADALPPDLPAAVEAATYRITMEAVTNVLKHAGAQYCWIVLHSLADPPRLQIHIEDDGVGLSPQTAPNVGLHSMRERAEELGGSFQIQSRQGGGTHVTVTLPLSEKRVTP
jgi:signal transduction histidine kinase